MNINPFLCHFDFKAKIEDLDVVNNNSHIFVFYHLKMNILETRKA